MEHHAKWKAWVFWIIILVPCAYVTWRAGVGAGLLMLVLSYLVSHLTDILARPFRWKDALIYEMAPRVPRSAEARQFEWLDVATFDEGTKAWRELGFEMVREQILEELHPKAQLPFAVFTRTLANHEGATLVTFSQLWMPTETKPVETAIVSFWGELDKAREVERAFTSSGAPLSDPRGISLHTPQCEAMPIWSASVLGVGDEGDVPVWTNYAHLHPRAIHVRVRVDTLSELWAEQQTLQARVSAVLGPPVRENLVEVGHLHPILLHYNLQARVKKIPTVRLLWRTWQYRYFPNEHWGELEGRV